MPNYRLFVAPRVVMIVMREPFFGGRPDRALNARMACTASSLDISRYAMTTYSTWLFGSLIACGMLGISMLVSGTGGGVASGSYRQAGSLDEAEEHRRHLALASSDVEVMHGNESEHVATVRAACHEKHVRGGRA